MFSTIIAAADSWTGADGMDCTFCWLKDLLCMQSSLAYVTEATLLLHLATHKFALGQHSRDNGSEKSLGQYLHSLFRSTFRAFGSLGLVLPIFLSKDITLVSEFDAHAQRWAIARALFITLYYLPNSVIPMQSIAQWSFTFFGNFANSIYEVAALVAGYNLGAEAYPDSMVVALACGFLGVYGAHIVEKGFGNSFDDEYANEYVLAVVGTLLYKAMLDFGAGYFSPAIAQCCIVIMRFSLNRPEVKRFAALVFQYLTHFRKNHAVKKRS